MRAVIIGDNQDLSVQEIDLEPQPGEVLLQVKDCGICGTDMHALKFPQVFGTGPGTVLGHEFCGEVVEVRTDVGGWRPGDRVVGMPIIACGQCDDCRTGRDWRCISKFGIGMAVPGAFAEYVRTSPRQLYRIPDNVSYRHAALTEPLAVGYHSVVRRGRLAPGEPTLIMGAGPVGLFTLIWARIVGAEPIVVSEPAAGRRAQALAFGADAVVDPREENPAQRMRDLTHGHRPQVVFECVGVPPTLEEAMRHAARDGRIVVVGVCMEPYTLQPMTAAGKELDVHYVFGYHHDDFTVALDALAQGRIPADALISDVIALDDVPAMIAALAHPSTQIKVLVEPALTRWAPNR